MGPEAFDDEEREAAPSPGVEQEPDSGVEPVHFVGKTVGNYQIVRHLANGGMSDVYVARHPELGREVAVKFLALDLATDDDLNQRFLQEARVTATLRHPGIVQIFDLGRLEGRPYYTMELFEGQDLAAHLCGRGRLSSEVAVDYLTQICDALSAAHEVSIVHRDLKPANIFVIDAERPRLKLMDFGIAKVRDLRRGSGTMHGEILGTPTHMAPEQALGMVERIAVPTDIYAVGVIAYEMLTGRLPFLAELPLALMGMHVRDPVPPLRQWAPDVLPALSKVVERCLAKRQDERPQSARELARELAEAVAAPLQRPSPEPRATAGEPSPGPADPPASRSAAVDSEGRARPGAPGERSPARTRKRTRSTSQARLPVASVAPPAPGAVRAPGRRDAPSGSRHAVAPRASQPPPPPSAPQGPAASASSPDSSASPCSSRHARREDAEPPALQEGPASVQSSLLLSDVTDDAPTADGLVTLSAQDKHALERVLLKMRTRPDFPSFLNNVSEISAKADANREYSAHQLSEAILKDFALTAKLLRVSNMMYPNRFGGKVYSVHQAVVILGFDSVRSMALGVSVFKMPGRKAGLLKEARGPFHAELAESAVNSLVAGELARVLSERAEVADAEAAMMCAIFRSLGRQLLMEYLPGEYAKIGETMKRTGGSFSEASSRVLGTSVQKLGVGIVQRWHLPDLVQKAMVVEPRRNQDLLTQAERISSLSRFANDFCFVISSTKRHEWDAALARLARRHENLLSLDKKEIGGLLGLVCKSFEERYSVVFGPYSRRSRFLESARSESGQGAPKARETPQPLSEEERQRQDACTQALVQAMEQKGEPNALLSGAIEQIAETLSARRCILLVASSDRQHLRAKLAVGEDAEAMPQQLSVPVSRGQDFFSQAFRTSRTVVVGDALAPKVMRRVPQRYYEVLGSASFALYACASRGYRTALLLVDDDGPQFLPPEDRVAATKPMRELVAKLLERTG